MSAYHWTLEISKDIRTNQDRAAGAVIEQPAVATGKHTGNSAIAARATNWNLQNEEDTPISKFKESEHVFM